VSKHIIADIVSEDPKVLDDQAAILEALTLAAKAANATILRTVSHKFDPQGVTAFILLAESHISIHTWPELNRAAVDIYTCGTHTDPESGLEALLSHLMAKMRDETSHPKGHIKKCHKAPPISSHDVV
jgi:S-adenosylmethionine decarboxylase proenzyme, Bacillus form